MKAFFLVFLGGGLGSGIRYLVAIAMNQYSKFFPFGTFTVNMLGCLLIGLILGYAQKENTLTSNQIHLMTTGFCGGFTTFSAFADENLELLRNGDFFNLTIYILTSIFTAMILIYTGYTIAGKI